MTILNERLIEQQGLSSDEVAELEYLHETREILFAQAEVLDPEFAPDLKQLQLYADLLESLEYNMQRVWKFKQDASFHSVVSTAALQVSENGQCRSNLFESNNFRSM